MSYSLNYETASGKDVIVDFIDNKVSNAKDRAILTKILSDTMEKGVIFLQDHVVYIDPNNYSFKTEPLTKNMKVKHSVFEVKYSDYRILYATKGKFVYFLNIFRKKTNKCPTKELNKAIQRSKEID